MTDLGFQLHSLHAVDDSLHDVVRRVGEAPFDGVEFAGLDDADPAELADTLDDAGLAVAGAHVDLDALESDVGGVADTYAALGCRAITVPWLDPEHFDSVDAVEAAADRLTAVGDALDDRGFDLHYHNHDQGFVDLDGEPALDVLLDAADGVGLELDLGWAGAAGHDPLAVLDDHADRVDLVHLKDYDETTRKPTAVGTGDLDVEAAVELVRDHEFDWLVYEAEGRPDSYETLAHATDVVEQYW
ncbi:sugar phosphate isomerase/epimerase family protein [Halobaculum sp. P14]|uniref:sugar phosphate isomerase/epimerase family protein n=1 Tax=Halobaculum sp. P14 TaxID=3421638 RepID=UPI003EBACF56